MNKKESSKKDTTKKKKGVSKDFFNADWNDEVYVQRMLSKRGGIGGRKLG